MPVKRRRAKGRTGSIRWDTLTDGERRFLLDLPHPAAATLEEDFERWGLTDQGGWAEICASHGKPTLRQLWDACEADIRREWPHKRPPSYLYRLGVPWTH